MPLTTVHQSFDMHTSSTPHEHSLVNMRYKDLLISVPYSDLKSEHFKAEVRVPNTFYYISC
jgi:hypothetical protein